MKKKLLSTLLAAAMLLTLAPAALAADDFTPQREGNGVDWEGGTVTLTEDVTLTDRVYVFGDTTLDLNGYAIDCATDDNPFLIWGGATLTVTGEGTIDFTGQSSLFYVNNYRREFTPSQYDEEGNCIQEEIAEDIPDVGRLVLEGGTFNAQIGGVVGISEGAEAEIGAVTLNGSICNRGAITSIRDTKITADRAGILNLGTIETIEGCDISTPENNIENYGEIDSITNTQLTSTRTEGGAALNNQGYIGTIGEGVRIDCAFGGIGNDSTHSTIDTISMEYIRGGAEAISNRGTIHTIAAGEFDAEWHGMENFFGTVDLISGGSFNADIINHNESTIKKISGGTFSGRQCGLSNGGTIERITGGTFIGRWENMAEDIKDYVMGIDNDGKIGIMSGYTLDGDTGYGIRNKLPGEIDELGEGVLIGELGKVNNEATIHKIFDESILAGNNATGEAAEKPTDEEKVVPEFTDMTNHWAAGDVSALAAEGVIDGLPDGTFGPANDVTRGELAKLVLTVSGREEKGGEAAFADTEGTWSMKYVNGLAGVGIIRTDDYPDGFQQGEEATRVEVITMLMRSMGYDRPMGEVALTFTDVDGLTDEQAYYVDCAVRRGIIKGMPDGTLKPDENISRAEVATMLRRAEAARPGK